VSRLLFAFVLLAECRESPSEIHDPVWKEESLKMAGEICAKIRECGFQTGSFQGLDTNESSLLEQRLTEASCKAYHKKTNAYLLRGEDPEWIKKNSRDCHRAMLSLSCDELVSKKFLEFSSCTELSRIQKNKQ